MAGIRASTAVLAVAFLLAPAAAWAGHKEGDSPERVSASPGDRVGFEVPDSDKGDSYTVSVEDKKVADGVDDTGKPGFSGEFTMPDLGSEAREVTVLIQVTHAADDSTQSYESKVDYRPASSPEASPTSEPSPPRPAPRPSSPAPASRPASKPAAQIPVPVPVSPAPTRVAPEIPSEPVGQVLRTPERVLRGLTEAAPLRPRGSRMERRKAKRHARKARRRANHFRAGPDPTPPKVRSLSPPRDTRVDLSDDSFPGLGYSVAWKLLVAVAAAGLLLALLLGTRTRRRRREAEMEAELQEMVSEGRADSHLLS